MDKEFEKRCFQGLSFFGRMNRIISHEFKNIFAIISESLGLLDELMEMSESGAKLPPGKLKSLSESVMEEIGRANAVAKNMNAFAHSVDEFACEVDINQVIELMVNLSELNSLSRNIDIHFEKESSGTVYTVPFFLENLIYQIISFSAIHSGPDHNIEISVNVKNKDVKIIFSGIEKDLSEPIPSEQIKYIAQILSAKISSDIPGEIHIVIPDHIEA